MAEDAWRARTFLLLPLLTSGCSAYVHAQGGYISELTREGPNDGGVIDLNVGLGGVENEYGLGAGGGIRHRWGGREAITDIGINAYGLVGFGEDGASAIAAWARAGTWVGGGEVTARWSHALELGGAFCPFAGVDERVFHHRAQSGRGMCLLLSTLAEYDLALQTVEGKLVTDRSAAWLGVQVGLGYMLF